MARAPDTLSAVGAVQINRQGCPGAERWFVVDVKRIIGLLLIALLLFFVFTQPVSAATSLQNIGATLRDGAESITVFFTQLV